MFKYAKIINEVTKQCDVGLGNNEAFYISQGMTGLDVEQGYDMQWYIKGFAPAKPAPTIAALIVVQQKILDDTDYKAIKAFETGIPMSDELKQKRQDARDEINRLKGLMQKQENTTEETSLEGA